MFIVHDNSELQIISTVYYVRINTGIRVTICGSVINYLYYIQRKIFSESVVLCHNAPD